MPKITAQAKVFRDWEAVLGASAQNAPMLPGVDPLKGDLDALLAQARDLKIQQESLEGQRMGVTQKLTKVIEDGREAARKLRAFAVVHLGTASKALAQFGVTPRQRRGKKSQATGTPPPTVGSAQTPAHNQTESTQGKEGTHV
ncbi:MAG TPA: hypothetical protein VGP73_28600 [Thermoanaerobaculia bacterium]